MKGGVTDVSPLLVALLHIHARRYGVPGTAQRVLEIEVATGTLSCCVAACDLRCSTVPTSPGLGCRPPARLQYISSSVRSRRPPLHQQRSTHPSIHPAGNVQEIGPSFRGQFKWLRGVDVPPMVMGAEAFPAGACFALPSNASSVLKIDPATHTVTTFGGPFEGDWLWHGGALAADGCVDWRVRAGVRAGGRSWMGVRVSALVAVSRLPACVRVLVHSACVLRVTANREREAK